MKTIWKQPLIFTDHQVIQLPRGSHIVSVINQNENLVLYFMTDDKEKKKNEWEVFIRGTGHEVDFIARYIGTVLMADGKFIWHVFARIKLD